MSRKFLFIFEGKQPEKRIFDSIKRIFLVKDNIDTVIAIYEAEIYQVFKDVTSDDCLDLFEVLKERSLENRETLANFTREDFAQIFLFFDYDGQSSTACHKKLIVLLDYFNEETDNGKLYLSYPMVEAFHDLNDAVIFKDRNVDHKITGRLYKRQVNTTSNFQDIRRIDENSWKNIISEHHSKAHYITCDKYEVPNHPIKQEEIFHNQLEKFIYPHEKVAVLSGFPLFLIDYYNMNLPQWLI